MREQTQNNVQYVIGIIVLNRLAQSLGWTDDQLDAAGKELIHRFRPTLVEIG
jgi:hypothetical protein